MMDEEDRSDIWNGVLTPVTVKQAAVTPVPLTGPDAIHAALSRLNLDRLEEQAKAAVKSKKVTKRPGAVQILNTIEGLRRNGVQPQELMIQSVPVLPPVFRPFSMLGSTFVKGDANELYSDLFYMREAHKDAHDMFGEGGSGAERMQLYDAARALYGYGDPVRPKTKLRGVSGFMRQLTGVSPKFSIAQRRLLSKAQDSVSRGVAVAGADLGMDEIGVPENMAWTMYAPYIQRRLAKMGLPPALALKHVADRTALAKKALDTEIVERPVVYSRSPAWHRYSVISGHANIIPGDTIATNPYVSTGLNLDHDGDTLNLHLPSQPGAVKDAREVLLPSKMLFSIRDQNRVVPVNKHEQILGLYAADKRPASQVHQFASREEALAAIKSGQVSLKDEVDFPDPSDTSI